MHRVLSALAAAAVWSLALSVGCGAAPVAPADRVVYVDGSSEKLCQLVGETDRQSGQSTANRTATRFGLIGSDLGYSFEHDGKLFFLFGDSVPTPKFRGRPNGPTDPPRTRDDNDAIAFTSDTASDRCPTLEFIRNAIGAYKNPVVLNAQDRPVITLAGDEVPTAGISENGRMYVIFGTDSPTHFEKPPNHLVFATRTVMAVSDDDANTWRYLYDFSKGPDAKFINTAIAEGADGYLYFWGTRGGPFYYKSPAFMARMQAADLGRLDGAQSLEYLADVSADGRPRFSKSEADAAPLFHDYLQDASQPHDCMGELGVHWNGFVKRWVMLYNCLNDTPGAPRGIRMRVSERPWGPWSAPQTIFSPDRDRGYCVFMHRAVDARNPKPCDDLAGPDRAGVSGRAYGPYVISRFTTGDAAQGTSTLYYTMSTWNPYTQVIMRSTIRLSP